MHVDPVSGEVRGTTCDPAKFAQGDSAWFGVLLYSP